VRNILFISLSLLLTLSVYSQEDTPVQEQLEEVVISSQRIAIPFSEDSRTITIITSEEIQKSAAFSVADLLQQVAGVDIRRRGTAGMQADLYIRGGGFDQTLLLIDGIKVEDAQTGHHTLNMALPLEVIERIEIIKGPAARVYGQNAFTGAVNIITKKDPVNAVNLGLSGGSYQQLNGEVTVASNFEHSSHLVHFSRNTSEGYRYNTDYDNTNYFLKSIFNSNKQPIEMIGSFSERKFGANGFYASPAAKDQYEETQTSLVGATTTLGVKNSIIPQGSIGDEIRMNMFLYDKTLLFIEICIRPIKLGQKSMPTTTQSSGSQVLESTFHRYIFPVTTLGSVIDLWERFSWNIDLSSSKSNWM
jgi:vitamin B12 transporter